MTTDGHPLLPLTLDELLTTTRAVRKRLDVTRPVDRSVIEECLEIAQQAPSASNRQHWHFVITTDPPAPPLRNPPRSGGTRGASERLPQRPRDDAGQSPGRGDYRRRSGGRAR